MSSSLLLAIARTVAFLSRVGEFCFEFSNDLINISDEKVFWISQNSIPVRGARTATTAHYCIIAH